MENKFKSIVEDHISVISKLNKIPIIQSCDAVSDALKNNNKIILFGNGGSASDAEHIAAEFVGKFQDNRFSLPAIALTTSGSLLTSIGNDFGFDKIFVRQVCGLSNPGDVCIGLSTSGKSKNVLVALSKAKQLGCKTIFMTGNNSDIQSTANINIFVPSESIARIQETHILIGHIISEYVDMHISEIGDYTSSGVKNSTFMGLVE